MLSLWQVAVQLPDIDAQQSQQDVHAVGLHLDLNKVVTKVVRHQGCYYCLPFSFSVGPDPDNSCLKRRVMSMLSFTNIFTGSFRDTAPSSWTFRLFSSNFNWQGFYLQAQWWWHFIFFNVKINVIGCHNKLSLSPVHHGVLGGGGLSFWRLWGGGLSTGLQSCIFFFFFASVFIRIKDSKAMLVTYTMVLHFFGSFFSFHPLRWRIGCLQQISVHLPGCPNSKLSSPPKWRMRPEVQRRQCSIFHIHSCAADNVQLLWSCLPFRSLHLSM